VFHTSVINEECSELRFENGMSVCCNVLQCGAVMQCVAVCCGVLHRVAVWCVWCNVLQCIAVCCSVFVINEECSELRFENGMSVC